MHYLIANPIAGRGRSLKILAEVESYYKNNKLDLKVFLTKKPKHATEIARALPNNSTIIALGGDGTVHEVAATMIGSDKTLGIIPAGSGDDLAFALDIPRNNVKTALSIIANTKTKLIDSGTAAGEFFVNSFGVGFDADVSYAIRQAPKALKGRLAYVYAILSTLRKLKNVPVKVRIDDKEVFHGPSLLVSVQNGKRTGGSFLFAPNAVLDDGIFEIIIAADFKAYEVPIILPKLITGKYLPNPKIHVFRGKDVSLTWEKERPGHMEGELLAASADFKATLLPKSLRVIVP